MTALPRKAKELVASLISYFEQERDNGGPLIPVTAVRERVTNALNLSLRTVNAISQMCKSGEPLCSPKKTKRHEKPITNIDDFDQIAIHNTFLTLKMLLQALREKDIFHGSLSSLQKIMHNIGFHYMKDNREN
ncbi:hypothetical protein ILUMI_07611 [Ignelater luminosus]|uniref:Uncharacterized protein n=1 Tax=Ignelater luminosus TaxID=2038154 RepID=A0A8K0D7Y7_IGNLU|nr:hypothetical protein ILUMI_07611 [Ignelater luminosus]